MSRRPAASRAPAYSAVEASLGAVAERRRRGYAGSLVLAGIFLAAAFAAGTTRTGSSIIFAIQRFLEYYVDVFALVGLTATVAAGLIASDRIIMAAGHRIVAQAIHRALALLAIAFLATHIVLEVLQGYAGVVDAVVPFLNPHRTFYVGLGTIASDLLVVIVATGIMRRRFTGDTRPRLWRALHWMSYAAWPMAIVHGLLAGRHAKPYVDWSYGACMIVVGVALVVRAVAEVRPREVRTQSPADGAGLYLQAVAQAAVQARLAGHGSWQQPRALPGPPPSRPPVAGLPAGDPSAHLSPPAGFPSAGSLPPASLPPDSLPGGFPSQGSRRPGFPSARPPAPASPPVGFPSVNPPAPASPPVGFPSVDPPAPASPPVGFPSVDPPDVSPPLAGFPPVPDREAEPAAPWPPDPWPPPRPRRPGDRR